eukprot:1181292-Prorocentrum_minimum.AAC.1
MAIWSPSPGSLHAPTSPQKTHSRLHPRTLKTLFTPPPHSLRTPSTQHPHPLKTPFRHPPDPCEARAVGGEGGGGCAGAAGPPPGGPNHALPRAGRGAWRAGAARACPLRRRPPQVNSRSARLDSPREPQFTLRWPRFTLRLLRFASLGSNGCRPGGAFRLIPLTRLGPPSTGATG